jgi:hypothetical protein
MRKPPSSAKDEIDRFLMNYEDEVVRRGAPRRHGPGQGDGKIDEAAGLESLKDAGILASCRNRNAAFRLFNPYLRDAQKVIVVGSSLKGLIHPEGAHPDTRTILRDRIGRQRENADGLLTTDFVLTHPAFADLRAEQETRAKQDIGREVIKSLMILKDWEADAGSVHLYLGTPTCFGVLADDMMLLNPYPYADVAFQSPCLLLDRSGYFFNAFELSHFAVLDQTMVVRLSDLPADIGDLYVSLKAFRERTDELLSTARDSTSRAGVVSETESSLESMDGFLDIVDKAYARHPEYDSERQRRMDVPRPSITPDQRQ